MLETDRSSSRNRRRKVNHTLGTQETRGKPGYAILLRTKTQNNKEVEESDKLKQTRRDSRFDVQK